MASTIPFISKKLYGERNLAFKVTVKEKFFERQSNFSFPSCSPSPSWVRTHAHAHAHVHTCTHTRSLLGCLGLAPHISSKRQKTFLMKFLAGTQITITDYSKTERITKGQGRGFAAFHPVENGFILPFLLGGYWS